jgi:hypothetical protein
MEWGAGLYILEYGTVEEGKGIWSSSASAASKDDDDVRARREIDTALADAD